MPMEGGNQVNLHRPSLPLCYEMLIRYQLLRYAAVTEGGVRVRSDSEGRGENKDNVGFLTLDCF